MLHTSTLEAVTVYAQGALCTRRIPLIAANGTLPERVRVEGLPLSLDAANLRARVQSGPAALTVREVKADFAVREAKPTEAPEAKAECERAEARVQALLQRRTRLLEELQALSQVQPTPLPPAEGAPPRPPALEGVLALADTVERELATLSSQLLELERERVKAEESLAHWRRVLSEASGVKEQTVVERAVEITLSRVAGDRAELILEYPVRGARWVPTYALALEPGFRKGQLAVRAQIAQATGEDWTDVRLSVSTASLLRRVEVPTLHSLRIGRAQPPAPGAGWREPPSGLDALLADFRSQVPEIPGSALPPPPPRIAQPAQVISASYAQLEQAGRADDGAPQEPEAEVAPPKRRAPPPAPRMARAGGPPPPAAAAAPMMVGSAAPGGGGISDEKRKGKADVQREEAPSEPTAPTAPGEAWMDYGALELAGPFDARPGRLKPGGGSTPPPPVRRALSQSQAQASAAELQSFPPGAVALHTQQFDDRYDADHVVRVPSDGKWHSVPLFSAAAQFGPELVCVPALDRRVFRTLELKNQSKHALLAGPADVTLGGMFLATVSLPAIAPGGVAHIGLGVEEAVQVSRNVHFREETGGLLGGTTLLVHEIAVEVVNRLSAPVSLKVRERVPVSEEREVVVEELAQKPAWRNVPVEHPVRVNGAREWSFELPAGAKQQLEAKVQIRIPSGRTLEGGNRRF